jgi:DNA-binding NtrC family response regulator
MEQQSIIGSHPAMQAIIKAVERLADTDRAVLVTGEKGTGKGLIARRLHARSARADYPFVHVDCADASPDRLERELFGSGPELPLNAWQRAAGGVLLLDELAALPPDLQGRLAEHLSPNGHGPTPPLGVRIVATSQHVPADDRLHRGLIECLEPFEVPLPALRQRRADIPILVEHFLASFITRHRLPPCRIETDALVHLWQYDWPGNVRELESVIERIVVLCRSGVIRTTDLPAHVCNGKLRPSPRPPFTNGNGAPVLRPSI